MVNMNIVSFVCLHDIMNKKHLSYKKNRILDNYKSNKLFTLPKLITMPGYSV